MFWLSITLNKSIKCAAVSRKSVPSAESRVKFVSSVRPIPHLFLSRSGSVELQKANLESGGGSAGSGGAGTGGAGAGAGSSGAGPLASAIPLAQLLSKSGALGALSSLSALGGLTELLAGTPPVQTTGVHRSHKRRQDDDPPAKNSKERNKYNPY